MRFEETKSDTLNLRVSPSFKQALKAAADHEHRSMVNMLEVLVSHYCEANKITIPEKDNQQTPASRKLYAARDK